MSEVATLLQMIAQERIKALRRPVRIGLAGAQGSGKSTVAKLYAKADPRVATFSLDDVYATTAERKALAASVSPLFKVRGPPGTHDLELAKRTLMQLERARGRDRTPLPLFDKLKDARVPSEKWTTFDGTPNVMLVDGWCMGATPEPEEELTEPLNAVEQADASGAWRAYANAQLAGPYSAFFDRFDAFVFLAAPSWDVVLRWRMEQEATTRGVTVATLPAEIEANLSRFILHYERLTRHMLDGGRRPGWTVRLREDRTVAGIEEPEYPSVK